MLRNGKRCGRPTKMHKYICDKHAELAEDQPHGRYCEHCGIDTFNGLRHKKGCPKKNEAEMRTPLKAHTLLVKYHNSRSQTNRDYFRHLTRNEDWTAS